MRAAADENVDGAWYAGLIPRRSQVAPFVNETTLVPVMPLAQARTFASGSRRARRGSEALGTPGWFIHVESSEMAAFTLAKTVNRSAVAS